MVQPHRTHPSLTHLLTNVCLRCQQNLNVKLLSQLYTSLIMLEILEHHGKLCGIMFKPCGIMLEPCGIILEPNGMIMTLLDHNKTMSSYVSIMFFFLFFFNWPGGWPEGPPLYPASIQLWRCRLAIQRQLDRQRAS